MFFCGWTLLCESFLENSRLFLDDGGYSLIWLFANSTTAQIMTAYDFADEFCSTLSRPAWEWLSFVQMNLCIATHKER